MFILMFKGCMRVDCTLAGLTWPLGSGLWLHVAFESALCVSLLLGDCGLPFMGFSCGPGYRGRDHRGMLS